MKKQYKAPDKANYVKEAPTYFYDGNLAIPLVDMTPFQKMQIVRDGVTKTYLTQLKEETSLDYDALAQALSVTRSTLINKKGDQKFSDHISERIIAVAEIYSFGYEVFEDKDNFNQWMFSSNQALAGSKPFELMDNQFGREEVRNLIGRIAHGVFS
ncbi:type II toxin-antitoxin system Xre/ParS family antitoxin [Aequorivita xiaoshiensis]|uniref:MbcA/ParS/Xre antitoxin family protein n=1 Tax=Aequorivita xiaoshiensis TaxID=2874476 RepID=A0A9X1R373_9FLAO|nr:antitoxin Xre/MbcA/ParS toxin-binding domain-containing protein [Aequorivita xiaoshiensis]MCG2430733.1 MbcA/ParS/Xre antitoxin family protein [Aequorivita xiaoshiensis]